MTPKHHNPIKPDRTAHAPYNFIPLPEKVVPAETPLPGHDIYDPDRHTGYLECTLTTKSPVYTRAALRPDFFAKWADKIREMMKDDQARSQYAEFFHLDDARQPVMPGSTLRGMTRTLIEIVSYGKIQWVTDEPLIFRAVGDTTSLGEYYRDKFLYEDKKAGKNYFVPRVRAGYMRYIHGDWYIQPAQEIEGVTFARIRHDQIPHGLSKWHGIKNASKIWVKVGSYAYQPVRGGFIHVKYLPVLQASSRSQHGFQEAVLARSGPMNKKEREAIIFPPDQDASLIPIDDRLLTLYREQITQGQQKLLGRNGTLNDWQPVFYLMEDSGLLFWGHTWLFRIPYDRSPFDLVPNELRKGDCVDLPNAIFGFVDNKKEQQEGFASRVFFTDATVIRGQTNVWLSDEPLTPDILSSPKPTTFQHYLTQQEPDLVQVGRKKDGKPKYSLKLDHYASPPPHETTLRGHKLYWHKGPNPDFLEQKNINWEQDTQHTQIKPVKPGVRFRFRVYFENLSEVELGALLWVLDLPEEHYHKVGMGKPLGLGAVEIRPKLVLSDRSRRYAQLFDDKAWANAEAEESNLARFKQAFENYILDNMAPTERRNANTLRDVERIRMLLTMLKWPGPDPRFTEYMDLKDFKKRPVLPDPLHVQPAQSPAQSQHRSRGSQRSPQPQIGASSLKKSRTKQGPQRLKKKEDAKEGMIVKGVVKQAQTSRFIVILEDGVEASLPFDKSGLKELTPKIANSYLNMIVIAKIRRINKKGNIQLEALKWL